MTRSQLVEIISAQAMRWQDATQIYDETVGEIYGLGNAERLCLSLIWQSPQPQNAIAKATRLTPAAVTALVDRLEARGLVIRQPDPSDRRRVNVAPTKKANDLTAEAYGGLAKEGAKMLESYSTEELQAIARFTREATALQERMTETLLAGKKSR